MLPGRAGNDLERLTKRRYHGSHMVRHLRLYRAFVRNCLRQAVEFRANFWANVFTNLGWILALVVFLKLIFHNTRSVAGWSEPEMFLLVGTYSLVRAISDTLFANNLSDLPNQIRLGTMDFSLLRPVDSQFLVSLRFVALDNLGQLIGAGCLLAYGLIRHGAAITPAGVAAYLVLIVCAVILFYAMSLMAMTLSFWLVRVENLYVALETAASMARTPVDVFRAFGRGAQFFLTYVIPLAFLAAIPVKSLFGRAALTQTAAGISLSVILFIAARLFWKFAVRAYSSASS